MNLGDTPLNKSSVRRPANRDTNDNESSWPSGPFDLDDFRLEMFVDDTLFKIEGESMKSSRFYALTLTGDDIERITSNFLSSPSELSDLIQHARTAENPNTTIEITQDAMLIIYQITFVGLREKKIPFKIQLEELDLNPLQTSEKYLQKLPKENLSPFEDQLVKILQKVLEHSNGVEDQIDQIRKDINEIEEKLQG